MRKRLADMTPEECERARQANRDYYERNRERCLAQCKAAQTRRWADDPEGQRAKARAYYAVNRRRINAGTRRRKQQNLG